MYISNGSGVVVLTERQMKSQTPLKAMPLATLRCSARVVIKWCFDFSSCLSTVATWLTLCFAGKDDSAVVNDQRLLVTCQVKIIAVS